MYEKEKKQFPPRSMPGQRMTEQEMERQSSLVSKAAEFIEDIENDPDMWDIL